MSIARPIPIALALLVASLSLAGCKGKTPTSTAARQSSTATSGHTGAGTSPATPGGKTLIGGKLTVKSSDVGPTTELVAWLFGPLESAKGTELGTASAVDGNGAYSFQGVAPGTYHMQIGHTWSTPHTTDLPGGGGVRHLDYAVKISPNNEGGKDALATDDTTTVTVTASTSTLPAVTVTADVFPSTWTPTDFVPKDGDKLPVRAFLEFNLTAPEGATGLTLVVNEGDNQVFTETTGSGHVVWHQAHAGTFKYQVTATLASHKKLTSPWYNFTIGS